MINSLPLPGTQPFLPTLLNYLRSATPALPLEPVIIQVLLLSIVAGNKNLILRTRDEDISLVVKLTALALNAIFGYSVHKFKCHSNCANQTPSQFLRSLFLTVSAITPPTDSGKHKHKRISACKLPIAPSVSVGSTARSMQTSISHPSESKTTLGRPHSVLEDADTKVPSNVECHACPGTRTDTSVPALASTSVRTHLRNPSYGSTEALKLPSVLVVSGLELANLPCQKAVLRTLVDRKIVVSDQGTFGHDQDGLTLELPDEFFIVYVCRSDSRERPAIYKSLLDRFAMSSSVDVGAHTRLAIRQYRPPSFPPATLASPCSSITSAAFPASYSSSGPTTPSQPLSSPVIPHALVQRLKHLCATRVHIRPPLNIYLADLFSATRHYGPLDAMMLTVRARQDAEALVCANRVLGADLTGAELLKGYAERFRETTSISTHPYSHTGNSTANSSDGLVDGFNASETYEPFGGSNVHHSVSSPSESEPMELDVSEADIARMFPRVVTHRIRVRDSPFDEVLSSAVCGAVNVPGEEFQVEEAVEWERETVKDILVHILAEV